MADRLDEAIAVVDGVVGTLEPGAWSGEQALAHLDRFDHLVRLSGGGRALAAGRIDAAGAWKRSGHRSVSAFLADRLGISRGEALAMVHTATQLGSLGELDAAVRAGHLSAAQAAAVAECAGEHPDAEAELMAVARAGSLRDLRDRCGQVASRGEGAEERHQRARRQRRCVDGTRSDGSWGLTASMSPVDGAIVARALDAHQRIVFDEARRRGERDGFAAYRADALVRMAQHSVTPAGGGASSASAPSTVGPIVATRSAGTTKAPENPGSAADEAPGATDAWREPDAGATARRVSTPRPTVVIRIDHAALWRGCTAGDEVSEIAGVGPVPVSHVRDLLARADPLVKALVVRGRDVAALATVDRHLKDDLRLAVLERDRRCQVPGCGTTFPLEIDHHQPVARDGPETYENLRALCGPHHEMRDQGYELVGPPGARQWLAPDGTVLAADPGCC